MLSMRNNRFTALFGCSCHPSESKITADIRKKQFINNIFLAEIRGVANCVMVTACALNPFTEQNAEFLYRE
jgi:hypothetical protein